VAEESFLKGREKDENLQKGDQGGGFQGRRKKNWKGKEKLLLFVKKRRGSRRAKESEGRHFQGPILGKRGGPAIGPGAIQGILPDERRKNKLMKKKEKREVGKTQ